ncbi:MAG: ABC transporter ATP-binding protein [Flammeovirgaceae bacterium]
MIKASNLIFTYKTGRPLSFPNVAVGSGEPCLLLGESGSGKTTLLHLMGGLLRAQQGSILIAGTDISKLSEPQLDRFRARHMGFIFQKNHLISALTVAQNIVMAPYLAGNDIAHERVEEVLEGLQLTEKRNAHVTELSVGQAQRVAIARAVINKPSLILADEPTSSLDDANCMRAIQLLLNVARQHQAALLVATHDQRLKNVIDKQIHLTTHS